MPCNMISFVDINEFVNQTKHTQKILQSWKKVPLVSKHNGNRVTLREQNLS